jgi:hypothetical protein
MSEPLARRVWNLGEAALAVVLSSRFAALAQSAALAVGVTLPSMPLLRHTYLGFAFTLLVLLWVKMRGENWADFGLSIPKRWPLYILFGVALAIFGIVLDGVVRSITTPLIVKWTGADPHLDTQTFADINGNLELYLLMLPCIWIFAGFGEEAFFRGYLMTRISQVVGGGKLAWAVAVVGQGVLFALAHSYQGPVGMVPIGIGAMVTGGATLIWRRNLLPAMIAHGLVDTLGFTMLYLGIPLS